MTTSESTAEQARRHSRLELSTLDRPAALIFNPNAGQKLGLSPNTGDSDAVQAALKAAGVPFEAWPTERAGHAGELARQPVAEGRRLVIAVGAMPPSARWPRPCPTPTRCWASCPSAAS